MTYLKPRLPPGWDSALRPLWSEPFYEALDAFLAEQERAGKIVYPERRNIFRAFEAVDLPDAKVVIFGQDPYHGPGQAMGLSFAVPNGLAKKPPSLKNIFKEIESEFGAALAPHESDLSGWTGQGVLLLNTVLTVEQGKPLSHRGRGWENFTDEVIRRLNARNEPVLFILWGNHAKGLKERIDLTRHAALESNHPSPLSAYRGFFGSGIFLKANDVLRSWGKEPIDWTVIST